MSPYHDEDNVVGIEFGYGVKTSKGDLAGEFYIGNDHREFVQSDSSGYTSASSSKLAFFFPSDGCLRATAGIFSKVCFFFSYYGNTKFRDISEFLIP